MFLDAPRRHRLGGVVCLLLTLLAAAPGALAQSAPGELLALSAAEVDARLSFVEQSLAEQRGGAIAWWTGWMSFNLFNTGFAWARFADAEKPVVRDALLGSAVGASLFVLTNSVRPLPALYAARSLRRRPEDTPEQRRAKLVRGVELMERSAKVERTLTGPGAHLSALLFATGAASYVYFRNMHEQRKPLALAVSLEFLLKVAVAEITLWTVPRKGRRHLARYRARFGAPAAGP